MILLLFWCQHALLVPMTMARLYSQASNERKIINPAGIVNTVSVRNVSPVLLTPIHNTCIADVADAGQIVV